MGIGFLVLAGYLVATGRAGMVASLSTVQWAWVLGTGLLLSGYVATWYGALRRAPATVVTAVLVAAAPITAALSAFEAGSLPEPTPAAGYLLALAAVALLAWAALRSRRAPALAA
jgi:drug/metabolite transporter (DMT)-like permease